MEPIHVPTLAIRGRVTTVTKKWNKVGSHQELVIALLRKFCYEQNAMTSKKRIPLFLLDSTFKSLQDFDFRRLMKYVETRNLSVLY